MISVIIPVYNCEKYISRCVDSVLNQSYKDFELILVDDGSTDSSGVLCDGFLQRDKRVLVIHKKNGGASSARNAGLEIANGDYIAFIDADDWVDANYLDALIKPMIYNQEVDIVLMPSVDESSMELVIGEQVNKRREGCIEKKAAVLALIKKEISGIWAVWSKVYKRKIFNSLKFNEALCYGEDLIINLELFLRAQKIYYVPLRYYHYFHGNLESINKHATNVDYWGKLLQALLLLVDDERLQNADFYEPYCRLVLHHFKVISNLIVFNESDYESKLQILYSDMGPSLLKIFESVSRTPLMKLQAKIQGSCEGLISMIDALENYHANGNDLYIYGAGKKAKRVSDFFARKNILFNSFIVSDGQKIGVAPDMKHPVIHFSDFLSAQNPADTIFFLALKEDYAEEVLPVLSAYQFKHIFYL